MSGFGIRYTALGYYLHAQSQWTSSLPSCKCVEYVSEMMTIREISCSCKILNILGMKSPPPLSLSLSLLHINVPRTAV